VGVALSDEGQTLATPFEIIQRESFAKLLVRLERIVAAENVVALLIGYPLSLSGEAGPQAQYIEQAARRIAEHLQLPLTLWDERFSSVRAEELLAEQPTPRRRLRSQRGARDPRAIDAVVAALLLQEYLDARRAEAEVVRDDDSNIEDRGTDV
jgi:putative Holliday junction resolvase